jgi:hypothetical protein
MVDIATTLDAMVRRAVEAVIDDIAKDGLRALRSVLDRAGFSKSEYLRDYEVYAHVSGGEITFEIVLDVEAVVPEDTATQQAMEEQEQKAEEMEQEAEKTFHLSRKTRRVGRLRGLHDARRGAKDARSGAKDARKTAGDRLTEHELARLAPRSARITRTGKLSVALKRSIRETEKEVKFPEGKFQGILGDFVDELKDVVFDKFAPELQKIVERYVSG